MKNQVYFFFIVFFVASVSADESPLERDRKIYEECHADPATLLERSALENARKGNIDVETVGPHILCMNVKFGLQKPNGDIDKQKLREAIKTAPGYDETKADIIVEECGTRKGATAHEAAIALNECYTEHIKRERHDQ